MSDYTKTTWVSGGPPGIDAPALNNIETGIDAAHDELEQANARWNLFGGDPVRYSTGNVLGWSQRLIVMMAGRGAHMSTTGYFEITQPTTGTCTGVGGAANRAWSTAGVTLAVWEALYYILPIGLTNASVAANFRVATFTSDLRIPPNWVLIATRSGDETQGLRLWDGRYLRGGHSTRQHQGYPPVEHWSSSAMPPADESFEGKRIYCTGLANSNFNNRLYMYRSGMWRLAAPFSVGAQSGYADNSSFSINAAHDVNPIINLGVTPVNVTVHQMVDLSLRPIGGGGTLGLACRDIAANLVTTQKLGTNTMDWYIANSMRALWNKLAGETLNFQARITTYSAAFAMASAAQFVQVLNVE